MPLTLDSLASIVTNAKFHELIDEIEGQFLDVKSQPYKFADGSDAKREFAKDVAAFANAQGGYILVGFSTKISTVSSGEELADVRPIPATFFDTGQHYKLLQEWLYPQPVGVDITFVPFGAESGKGILVVFIPPQDELSKPFLITKTLTDKKITDVLVGYVERRLDSTEPRTVVELHHALRIGLNLERTLLGKIDGLETLMTQHFAGVQQAEGAAQASLRLQERITRLLDEV
jgi:Putative DNA-binding domain